MTKITLVRHGTTVWVEQGKLHGRLDSPLGETGRKEAGLVAEHLRGLHFDVFLTSPAGRAVETANIISHCIDIEPVEMLALQELDFGWLEGKKAINALHTDGTFLKNLQRAACLIIASWTGESRSHQYRRIRQFLDWLLLNHAGKSILLVTHASLHRVIFDTLLEAHLTRWSEELAIQPCGISEVLLDKDNHVEWFKLNQIDHLRRQNGSVIPEDQRI